LEAYIADGLWLRMAGHANAMMARLSAGLARLPDIDLYHRPQGNLVFLNIPLRIVRALEKAGFHFYHWGNPTWHTARLVTAFTAGPEPAGRFLAGARKASSGRKPKRPMAFLPRP